MLRTHNCGQLRLSDAGKPVTLCGWVQTSRDFGGLTFVDLRDRYGITQLAFNMGTNAELCEQARKLSREFVVQVSGTVRERENKNPKIGTGDVEIVCDAIKILNVAKTPPFTIEDETDGGDDLRMKYRYLDIRRTPVRESLMLRHKLAQETRQYLSNQDFIEVETPVLIKSTPEGARDFVVPSRMNAGQFYALPQSPQTFKQLLMVAGMDRYFQIVKCFRDEDLRADRQPEFTQIDCEMSFVERADILEMFEGLIRHLFQKVKGVDIGTLPHMSYADAAKYYGNDKPDTRFEMKFVELNDVVKGKEFKVFNDAELVVGICAKGAAGYTRKQLDELTEFVKRPQIGATGLVYARYNGDGTIKSSVDKFYNEEDLKKWATAFGAEAGDLMLILAGGKDKTRKALSELRLEMGTQLGLRDRNKFSCLWVIDFPLLEYNEEHDRWFAMHHPFTAPWPEDVAKLSDKSQFGDIRANAYDMVINGVEVGGGSIRIFDRGLQAKMFETLGFTAEEAQAQFGFLMNAFEYGAPPHGGIAFGFDRLCSLFGGVDSIRDFIAFPKNNSGRDVMIDSPSRLDEKQLDEIFVSLDHLGILEYFLKQKDYNQYFKHLKQYITTKRRKVERLSSQGLIKHDTTDTKLHHDLIAGLIVKILGLRMTSEIGYDAMDDNGSKYEFNIHRVKNNKPINSFVIHTPLEQIQYDFVIFVHYLTDFSEFGVYKISTDSIKSHFDPKQGSAIIDNPSMYEDLAYKMKELLS